jgi:hypothetical protein
MRKKHWKKLKRKVKGAACKRPHEKRKGEGKKQKRQRRLTGRYTLRGLTAPRAPKTVVGLRPLCGFAPPHLGRGSLLRNALSPAPNVVYRRTLDDIAKNYLKIRALDENINNYCIFFVLHF